MRRSLVVGTLVLISIPSLVLSGETFVPPRTASPQMYVIRKIDKSAGIITAVGMAPFSEYLEKEKRLKITLKPIEMDWYVGYYLAHTAAGKRLDSDKVWEVVKIGQGIVRALDHNGIDPRYRALLKPDTIIISPLPPEKKKGDKQGD